MKTRLILIALVSLFLVGKPTLYAQRTGKTPIDNWYREPSVSYDEFSPQLSFRVRGVSLERSIEELANVSIKVLKLNEAETLVGNRISIPKSYKPYLVRGLYMNDATGGFALLRKGNALEIYHVGLGRPTLMKRQPLVVFLT